MRPDVSQKDWLIELGVRPHQMSPVDPPTCEVNEDYSRLLTSIYAMTLGESLFPHEVDPYLLEHIQMEREYMEQDDLTLVWSDDVALTLCFLASLAHHGDYSQNHLLERYFKWWMNGYMSPTGLSFTPRVHQKKSFDLFGEIQAAHALGIEVDMEKKVALLFATPASLLRLSPIAYFYSKHSPGKRREVIEDSAKRMFGTRSPTEIFVAYVELLVQSLNGLAKEEILRSVTVNSSSNDLITRTFFELLDLLANDNNNIEHGIQRALEKHHLLAKECQYLNPYDSDESILLTLYLQVSAAIYNSIPEQFVKQLYAKETLQSLAKWIVYQRKENLRST